MEERALLHVTITPCRVRDRKALTSALTVDPVYLQHEHDGNTWRMTYILVKSFMSKRNS